MPVLTFFEKYHQTDNWYEKCIIMEIYHLVRSEKNPKWSVRETANDFQVSIGLVSENLNLAKAMHNDPEVINQKSRQRALEYLANKK